MCSLKVKLSPNDHSRKSQRCSKHKENQWNIADMQMEVLWTRRLTFRGCEQFLANDHRKNRELDLQSLGARHHQQPEESGCGFSSKAKVERSDWLLWKQKSLGNSIYSNLISGCKQNSLVEKDIYYFWILIYIFWWFRRWRICLLSRRHKRSLGREDPLEKGMASHSSILAWRIPWIEEPGRLQSMGLQRF